MKILTGQKLVNEIRSCADKIQNRLWIAVPYIGNLFNVRRILGNEWIQNSNISVKLITDLDETTNFNFQSLKKFAEVGVICNIKGLHAKLYIMDDICFVTSANLTKTAFTKRTEIGVKLSKVQSKGVIEIFNLWWNPTQLVTDIRIAKNSGRKKKDSSEEYKGNKLPTINQLLDDPGDNKIKVPLKYSNYYSLLETYSNFSNLYKNIQRLWKTAPLYLEVDAFLNYLYHDHDEVPSNDYKDGTVNGVDYRKRVKMIKKYAKQFKLETDVSEIKWRLKSTRITRRIFSKRHIKKVSLDEVGQVFSRINSLSTYKFHRKNALEKNTIYQLRKNLNVLLHEHEKSMPERFTICSTLKNFKEASMYELIGIYYPEMYPLLNNNVLSGLRFFGYDVKLK